MSYDNGDLPYWDGDGGMTKLLLRKYGNQSFVTEQILVRAVELGEPALRAFVHHYGDKLNITESIMNAAAASRRVKPGQDHDSLLILLDNYGKKPTMTVRTLQAVLNNSWMDRTKTFRTLFDSLDERLDTQGGAATEEAHGLFTAAASSYRYGFGYIRVLLDVYRDQGPLSERDVLELSQYAADWHRTGHPGERPSYLS